MPDLLCPHLHHGYSSPFVLFLSTQLLSLTTSHHCFTSLHAVTQLNSIISGQEMCDHYMAPPNVTGTPYACMKEIQEECYKLGIPLKTRHREVAPGQYEFAPTFGLVTNQVDQNLMVMQISKSLLHICCCLFEYLLYIFSYFYVYCIPSFVMSAAAFSG